MANRRSLTDDAVELDGSESVSSVNSVAHDFAALVDILERQLELVAESDHKTRAHIIQAKAAAKRGAQLSLELLERMEAKA